jgi:hypothetical protein
MNRRTWLKLGLASAAALTVAGGAAVWIEPGWYTGRLSEPAREVFAALARGVLDGSLPPAAAQQKTLDDLLNRLEIAIANLPPHAQRELSQLLALLATRAGRAGLTGLSVVWPQASVADVQTALQNMRSSPISLKQQAYHALRDLISAAYFSAPQTWAALGYAGPLTI